MLSRLDPVNSPSRFRCFVRDKLEVDHYKPVTMMVLYFNEVNMVDQKSPMRPIYVVRAKSLTTPKSELLALPQYFSQRTTMELFTRSADRPVEPYGLIRRTQARFDPSSDATFQEVLKLSTANNEMILIDDYMRLIDCRDIDAAKEQVTYLKKHVPQLFSINHGSSVNAIPQKVLMLNVGDKVRQSLLHSTNIKSGLDKTAELNDGPTRKSIEAGVRSKKRIADYRALQLSKDIERIRLSLEEGQQSNLSVLAKALNDSEIKTPSGKGAWQRITVKRVLERVARLSAKD